MIRLYPYRMVILLLFWFLINLLTFSQESMVIQRVNEPPVLDGKLDDDTWKSLKSYSLIQVNPVAGISPTERSEFRIGFNNQYLFVAGYLFDREPEKIKASSKKRDEMQLNNDWFGVILDSFHDKENGLAFFTTPAALRLDMQILDDAEGNPPYQRDWNTVWDVATSVDQQGWYAEMRIPLSSIRFQVVDDMVTMGLTCTRFIARYQEWSSFPEISNRWGFWSWAKPSQFMDVHIKGVEALNPLYFSPYILGGVEQKHVENEQGSFIEKIKWERNIGGDIKWGLTKNLTLDLTLNTDFAQVEADDQQINLTRFSLFFPEKRQFFMERSSTFEFNFGSSGRLFYSRRIGLYEGEPVPIYGGGRLTGRIGSWDLGFLSLQTAPLYSDETSEQIIPSENHTVMRTRKQIPLNQNSYIGAMITSRVGTNRNFNLAYGLDAILNVFRDDYLKLAWAQSFENDGTTRVFDFKPSRFQVNWERRAYEGLHYMVDISSSGSEYNPGLGFEFRRDFTRLGANIGYGWIPGDHLKISRHQVSVGGYGYVRNQDGTAETISLSPEYDILLKRGHSLNIEFPLTFEHVSDTFSIASSVYIPDGKYTFPGLELGYETPSDWILGGSVGAFTGGYYDGWGTAFEVSPRLNLGNSWQFSMSYEITQINFKKRQQYFLSQLGAFRVLYMYSTALSASTFIQYNSLDERIILNFRIRFNPREGNDLYIVYNDDLNAVPDRSYPDFPVSNQRTILLKYTHTFRVR